MIRLGNAVAPPPHPTPMCGSHEYPCPANATSKSGIIATCSIAANITGAQGRAYFDALTDGAYANLKKNGSFVLPGFAKFTVKKKPARAARKGINPFTKEPCVFKAKPASKTVKARAIKAIKNVV